MNAREDAGSHREHRVTIGFDPSVKRWWWRQVDFVYGFRSEAEAQAAADADALPRRVERLETIVRWLHPNEEPDAFSMRVARMELDELTLRLFCEVIGAE